MNNKREAEEGWSEKAEQFQLRPSASVWKNIENDLQRHKRNRRIILWIFITGLLLITSGIALYNKHSNHDEFNSENSVGTKSTVQLKGNIIADEDKHRLINPMSVDQHLHHRNPKKIIPDKNQFTDTTIINRSTFHPLANKSNRQEETVVKSKNNISNHSAQINIITKKKIWYKKVNEESAISENIPGIKNKHQTIAPVTTSQGGPNSIDTNTAAFTSRSIFAKDGDDTAFTIRSIFAKDDTDIAFTVSSILAKDSTTSKSLTNQSAEKTTPDSTDKIADHGKLSFKIGMMPLISFNPITEHTDLGSLDNYRNDHTKTLLTYATEFSVDFQINNQLTVGTGFGIFTIGEQLKNTQALYRSDTIYPPSSAIPNYYTVQTVPSPVLLDSSKNSNQYIKTTYQYAEFPVDVLYTIFSRSKVGISVGMSFTYIKLIAARYYEYDFTGNQYILREKGDHGHLSGNNLAVSGNVAFTYRLDKHFGLYLAPAYKHFLNSLYKKESTVDQSHSDVGLKAGLTIYLK